jgi:hypothetical protein
MNDEAPDSQEEMSAEAWGCGCLLLVFGCVVLFVACRHLFAAIFGSLFLIIVVALFLLVFLTGAWTLGVAVIKRFKK